MAEQQPQRKPIPLNVLDVMSNWLYAEPVAGATKRPHLRVRVIGNVPRFTVKTNVPDDKDYGRIDFHCDLPTFTVIMTKLKDIAEGRDDQSYTWTYEDHIFINGQRSDKPLVKSSVRVGKDRDTGQIYFAVLGHNRPKIQFFFGPSRFHVMKKGDGSELTQEEISKAYATGFTNGYAELVYNLLCSEFDEDARNVPKPMGPGGAPQQGGGNRNAGGGNYQQRGAPATTTKADIAAAGEFDDFF